MTPRRVPWLTIAVFAVTAGCFIAQLVDDRVVTALQRDPSGLHSGGLWRVVSPLLIQSDGIGQGVFNLVTLLFFGIVVEWVLPRWVWISLYLTAGIVGQLLGYLWEPPGGGNSVAVCGLIGAVVVILLRGRPELPGPVYLLTPYYPASLLGLDIDERHGQLVAVVATAAVLGAGIVVSRRRSTGQGLIRPVVIGLGVLIIAEAVALLGYQDHHGAALLTGVAVSLLIARPS